MNKGFFIDNRKTLIEKTKDDSILILFAGQAPHKSADACYPFTPNRNFYYITGIEREHSIFMGVKKNGKVEATLYIERKDEMVEKWVGIKMTADEAKEASGIDNIKYIDEFKNDLANSIDSYKFDDVYMDLERKKWDASATLEQEFALELSRKYPGIKINNIYNEISGMRIVKKPEEVECIKKAIDITRLGIENMMKNSKPGMYEYELEAYFDFELGRNGVREHAFDTIAASGGNAVVLHYVENSKKTSEDELILCDLGASCSRYSADITRTFPVGGKFTDEQKKIYNIVLKALTETTESIKPGLTLNELNEVTKKVLGEGLKAAGLIKTDEELSKYYYHGVSHYLGLDTHDVGDRKDKLKPGAVITVEPGLYIKEMGLGIRIEDDVLVTENGYEVLSKNIIKTVEEIEEYMNK